MTVYPIEIAKTGHYRDCLSDRERIWSLAKMEMGKVTR